MAKTVDGVVTRWLERTRSGDAKAAYERGIDAVTTSPTEKAAEADSLFLRRVEESVRSGKRAASLRRVTLADWKQAAKAKGASRLATGAAEGVNKMRSFMTEFLPYVENAAQRVRAMPKGSLEDSKARMIAQMEANAAFRRSH